MLEEEQCCSGAGGVLVVRRRCSRGKIVAEKKRTPVGLWWAYRRNFIWVGENVREKTKWCARVVAEGGGSMGYSYDSNDRDNDEYERCPFCGSRGIDLLISDKGDLKYRASLSIPRAILTTSMLQASQAPSSSLKSTIPTDGRLRLMVIL